MDDVWYCEKCGFRNKSFNMVCGGVGNMGCKQPKKEIGATPKPIPVIPPKAGPRVITRADRFAPYGPGSGAPTPKPVPLPPVVVRPPVVASSPEEKWICAICHFANSQLNSMCGGRGTLGCKTPRDQAIAGIPVAVQGQGMQGQVQAKAGGPVLATYEQFLEHYGPENVMAHWSAFQKSQKRMPKTEEDLINQQLQSAVAQVLRSDPELLRLAVGEHYLKQCVTHLEHCIGSVTAPDKINDPAGGPPPFVQHVLDFADGPMLARLQSVSSLWQSWSSAPTLWKQIVYWRWPGTKTLTSSGYDKGDFKSLFRDMFSMEKGRRAGIPKQLALEASSLEQWERNNAEYYATYALLVQLADLQGCIFSSVVDLHLVNLAEQGTMVEGWLLQPTNGLKTQPGLPKLFERPVQDLQRDLKLSLVAIRCDDAVSCKYVCLCDATVGPEEELPKDELTFIFSAYVPSTLTGFVSSKYNYKCELSELIWSQDSDAPAVIQGFKRLRLWCEPDEDAETGNDDRSTTTNAGKVTNYRIGYLAALWDAYWVS
eukprot:gnl/MRDRNA2_/MRDRNA2_115734_c0_seq1.p1 gnl/MRDRNA2_/MRDRNA2_115734_c0~~gnl/MRDRNA2_/MRDRNA2_115734_c0_seq1.p1  ORF type:complete len:540 (+),score=80.07 gnl/MRDRNA2_/MRDRNA2_115734_c0_seq1:103-1722(+)